MAMQRASGNPEHVLRVTTRVAGLLALVSIAFGIAASHLDWGFAAAAGLVLGVANLVAADKLFGNNAARFFATSGARLVVLTLGALAVYLVFHGHVAIAFVVGVALAQLSLSVSALLAAVR
jgi:Na+(H+)/acetate symporter ActP